MFGPAVAMIPRLIKHEQDGFYIKLEFRVSPGPPPLGLRAARSRVCRIGPALGVATMMQIFIAYGVVALGMCIVVWGLIHPGDMDFSLRVRTPQRSSSLFCASLTPTPRLR